MGKLASKSGFVCTFISHVGDLNSYFNFKEKLKTNFREQRYELFADREVRYFVPEVNINGTGMLLFFWGKLHSTPPTNVALGDIATGKY